ncbi:MAG: molybdopterin-dependent oxidoreductase [Anaerolineaceae bacterium]|nr:molybdopterin-dependent oxidoreductase [Anaerolineaceae bacterium]
MTEIVGQPIQRIDALDKVIGKAVYAFDQMMPGMLHMKLVYAGRPHAKILAIDTAQARCFPGVAGVFTAADVPLNQYGIIVADRPVLCGDKVCHFGDQVAAVVADTYENASTAAGLIKVIYEDLPVIDDPEEALRPGAPRIHADYPNNIAHSYTMQFGDIEAAFARSDVIVSNEYRTPMQEHIFMEMEAGLGYIDDDRRVTLITAGQDVHEDQRQIAAALGLPVEQVRVIYGPIGGSFGGREDLTMQTALALATWKLQRPIKLVWNRSESIRGHAKRHAMILRHKWGAQRDGTIVAARIEIISDAGAYCLSSSSVLDNFRFAATGPYQIPNISLDAKTVYTNNVPGGAFRGFGFPQVAFGAELQIAHLAEELDIDPITMRLKNCLRDESRLATQALIPGEVSLAKLLETCAREIGAVETQTGWQMPKIKSCAPGKRRGVGLALGMKNAGFSFGFPEGSEAKVVLEGGASIERAKLYTAAADVGQGAHTVLLQICAEALKIQLDKIQLISSDTAITAEAGPASASRLTLFAGNAVKGAAERALVEWENECRPATGSFRWNAPPTCVLEPVSGAYTNSVSFMYAAHAVEIEVDVETGQITLPQVIAVHDTGKTVNPQQTLGQIEGGIVQAQGWSLLENFVTKGGRIYTDQLSTYLIPTVPDIPQRIKIILVENPDPVGPYGVRGIGEMPLVPLAPAIIAALRDAAGIWINRLPLTPEVVWQKINETAA